MLKTPAAYIEHTGDQDKSVDPIVIAARQPSEKEIRRALITLPPSAHLHFYLPPFLVKDEELAQVRKLIRESLAGTKPTDDVNEFRYVIVSGNGEVEIGSLDYERSRQLFAALASYFEGRQPQLHELLTEGLNWFWRWHGYEPPNKNSGKLLQQEFGHSGTIPPASLSADSQLAGWPSCNQKGGPSRWGTPNFFNELTPRSPRKI